MKNIKKKIITIVAGCTLAGLMMLNINMTISDSNFSMNGLMSLAYGTPPGGGGGDCDGVTCQWDHIEGFRCFYTGSTTYTCDDSGYPDCSDIRCDQ